MATFGLRPFLLTLFRPDLTLASFPWTQGRALTQPGSAARPYRGIGGDGVTGSPPRVADRSNACTLHNRKYRMCVTECACQIMYRICISRTMLYRSRCKDMHSSNCRYSLSCLNPRLVHTSYCLAFIRYSACLRCRVYRDSGSGCAVKRDV